MKARGIIWPALLAAAGLTCWFSELAIPQGPRAWIKVENDVADIHQVTATSCTDYDPYFIPENRCDVIYIPAIQVK
jgi:hypothetical protein